MGRFCFALAAVATFLAVSARASAPPVVQTKDGPVEGLVRNGVATFLGVPFAAPPIGRLRWRAPQPVQRWKKVLLATQYRPACMQTGMYPPDAPVESDSENCLYLNLWKPASPSSRPLPVMVWIYGGALENGSAAVPLYAGDQLARHGVIVVTLNYRLGVFGFLALPALTAQSAHHASGDYGLLDQIAALQWVHRNIAAFGGNPDNVTVFGQSSGSISISALTASPLAKGLFQKAIGESGGLFEPMELIPQYRLAGAEAQGQRFMSAAGARSLADLRSLPASKLIAIPFPARIIIDGYVVPRAPWKTYAQGKANKVSVLLGWNADEGTYFLTHIRVTPADYRQALERSFPALLVRLLAPDPGKNGRSARAAAIAFNTDLRFRWDMWRWARLVSGRGADRVYLYKFSRAPPYRPSSPYYGLGATHGTEMQYVFDHLPAGGVDWTAADRRLAAVMPAYWTRFARFTDPNGPGLPHWPRFLPRRQELMQLGTDIHAEPVADIAPLRRISRVYDIAAFVAGHWISIIVLAVLAVAAFVAVVTTVLRRKRAAHEVST